MCINYLKYYFEYNLNNIYLLDKYDKTFYGPVQDQIPNTNKLCVKIQCENFDNIVITQLGFNKGDLIIDLTYHSNTYFFVKRCLDLGINYINTSIEDYNDNLMGSSICLQQHIIKNIFKDFGKNIESNILIEFGQNPGLIQHYLIYAFNFLNKKKK
jgi:homospermidine synthase